MLTFDYDYNGTKDQFVIWLKLVEKSYILLDNLTNFSGLYDAWDVNTWSTKVHSWLIG